MDFSEKKHVPNPRATTNIFSKLLFWWIFPLFQKGAKQDLGVDDLYDVLAEDHSGELGRELAEAWEQQCKTAEAAKKKPKFYKALLKVYTKQYILTGIALAFDEWGIRVGQTLFLQRLIASFSNGSSAQDQYLYGTGVIVTTLLHTLVLHPTVFGLSHIGMKCRVSCCSVLYRKALRLSKAAQGQTTIGQLVNLMSNDVNRFDINLLYLHYLYIGPIQGIIFTYLLWTEGEFGAACLAGSGFVVLLIPVQYYIGKLFTVFRFQIAVRTDKRGQIMNEIIIAMRVIKMYAWEKPFSAMVDGLRRLEVEILKKTAYLRAFYLSLFISSSKLITYFTIMAFVHSGGELRASNVFFMVTVYNIMRQVMVSFVPVGAAHIGELVVSMNRIEAFLLLNEQQPTDSLKVFSRKQSKNRRLSIMDTSVVMTNVHAQWTKERITLDDVSVNLRGDKLVMVIGPVGSGKTSFLHALISELPITKGKCVINGRTSYASQEPWIFSGNLRQNILFGRDYDKALYKDVVEVSALEEDLRQLPFGENTIVGERGVALSGGQKARVNLARGLYQDADIYLLDDPLSAVDARVSRHIFEKCVRRYLKGKLRILVTHQLQYLPQADHIVVLNQGQILSQGNYHELVERGIDFVSLMASETEEDLDLKRKMSVQRAKSMEVPIDAKIVSDDKPIAQKESMAGGSVTGRTYWEYFKSGKSYVGMVLLACGFLLSQCLYSLSDYWLSYWTNESEKNLAHSAESSTSSYSSSIDYDESTPEPWDYDEDFYFYFYTGVVVAIFFVTTGRAIYFFQYCMNISINVHNQMFSSMVRAPTKFFDENPSGRIMNRFTKDIGSMDELLPSAFFDALSIMILMCGILIIVIISNYYVVIPAAILIFILVLIRRFFIKTARHVKRIEAVTRSPVFTHLAATIQGLTTIRASHSETILIEQFDSHQDIHSSAWYAFIAANRWFGVWLELISIVFLVFVTYGFTLLAGLQDFESGQIGLAISSCLGLTGIFQWGMRQTAETENLMTSVERALEYSRLEPEAPLDSKPDKKPPKHWPSGGAIRFEDVFLAYEDKDVLKNLNFDVKAKEKIGIVGRTGAGKSSIIAGLFRMTEPRGNIFVDDQCINHIGLHDLRKNISIIPQDPVLFSGTIRYNLDPFDQFKDPELWTVVEEVELKSAVPALDFEVADGGSNFSVGQRQLVCLARAILRKNKIIIMDEATANVDPRTDNFIQTTIREKFADCTIITIAHRLHSVMDCDRILVLDHGVLKEYDHPHKLLQNPRGILSSMVANTGNASSKILKRVAQETYNGRRPSFQVNNVSTLHRASVQIDVIEASSSDDGDNAEEEKKRLAAIGKILQQHTDSSDTSDEELEPTDSQDTTTAIQETTSNPEVALQDQSDGSSVSEEREVQPNSGGSDVSEEEHQVAGSDVSEEN